MFDVKVNDLFGGLEEFIKINEPQIKEGGTNFSHVEYYGRLLLLKYFQENDFFNISGNKYRINDVKEKIKLTNQFEKLFDVLLVILKKDGFIDLENDIITITDKVNSLSLQKDLSNINNFKIDLISKYNDMKCHFNLLDICLSNYNYILSGEKSPDGIMFPVYSTELVQGIFRDNMLSDYFNLLISRLTFNYINNARKNNNELPIKIIELGAGTGGTSIFVMDKIKDFSNVEYYFTDISKIFIRNFEKKNREKYPSVIYKKFDIENNISDQGFKEKSFDIVIASNVIHSTKNISNTLKNIKLLLKESGIFLLNEVTRTQDFTTLTFGLLGGWWQFTDPEIRLPYSPLLDITGWEKILGKSGFTNTTLVSSSDKDMPDSFSQSLFIAQ